jgi:tetratricopeptide (TPR) repeat protein
MTTIKELYKIFNLTSDCSDDELRRAYLRLMLSNHPDLNPGNKEESTIKTMEINEAYGALKHYRQEPSQIVSDISFDGIPSWSIEVQGLSIDIDDIVQRKNAFRSAWEAYQQQPTDILLALRLVHTAFEAERYREINKLIENPLVIDASLLLLSVVKQDEAIETWIRWAEYLVDLNLAVQGLQILEDAYSNGVTQETIREKLRSLHYGFAAGYFDESKRKPDPKVRITHLKRILDLGFNLGYIHKGLAVAYHEMGDKDCATSSLKRAYEINPELEGAVKISRALGFLPKQDNEPKTPKQRTKYIFIHKEQIPHPSQIREWAITGDWEKILSFSDLTKYSPRIIPSARSTIAQIANSLGYCPNEKARETLLTLQKSIYWDVRKASESSLKRFGAGSLHLEMRDGRIDGDIETVEKLWEVMVFESYHPNNDKTYLMALNILSNEVLTSNDPDVVLRALQRMTRWLEKLGLKETTLWIRELIRQEAAGTMYVNSHDRLNYIENVKISDYLKDQLTPILESVQKESRIILTQLLSSSEKLD